jgi:hypothetical protein
MEFTSHNIRLNDGTKTLGDKQILLSDSQVWRSIKNSIDLFMPGTREDRSKLRVVDTGCLEGGYTVEFAKMGFQALGIEAREENIAKCNYVKSKLDLPNLSFATDDVKNLDKYGQFDISLCYGLLYHLDEPVKFLKLLANRTNKILFLNTHYAPERDYRYNLGKLNSYLIAPLEKRKIIKEHQRNYRLSPITTNEGRRGRWFQEWTPNLDKKKIEKSLWASYSNYRSFWLCKKELTNVLQEVGFTTVFEQFNYTGDLMPDNYADYYSRTMFVAVKH